MNGVGRPRKTS